MDKAVVLFGNDERLVSAAEFKTEGYERPYGREPNIICPLCHQPVHFVPGGIQAPHFRHNSNNPDAKLCDLFSKGAEPDSAQYERIPSPLFIRQKRGCEGVFVIELGLKCVRDDLLAKLEVEGAVLVVGSPWGKLRTYHVNQERFGSGSFRVPISVARDWFRIDARLSHSAKRFDEIWPTEELDDGVAVFKCDTESLSGRKVGKWGRVALGDNVLIVAVTRPSSLESAFPELKPVGVCESRLPEAAVEVYLATVGESSVAYLQAHDIEVDRLGDAPEVLWPPSLSSAGEIAPLFSRSDCVFSVRSKKDGGGGAGGLYVHSKYDTQHSSKAKVEMACGEGYVVASVPCSQEVRFISTRNWAFSNVVLLGYREEETGRRLSDLSEIPQVNDLGHGAYEISFSCISDIQILRRGGSDSSEKVGPWETEQILLGRGEALRVYSHPALSSLHGKRLLLEISQPELHLEPSGGVRAFKAGRLMAGLPQDRQFAELRLAFQRNDRKCSDVEFAIVRRIRR